MTSHVYTVQVHFGDCDPAGIVFFPNFSRWMDQASLAFFMACGVPPWRELARTRGIIGTPVLEIQTQFVRAATYGEQLQVHTTIESWAAKTFTHRHQVRKFGHLSCAIQTTPGASNPFPFRPIFRRFASELRHSPFFRGKLILTDNKEMKA
jgi:4-hydroxybenzoyl-CoA thioesterase